MSQGMLKQAAKTARERWAEPLASRIGSDTKLHRAAQAQTIISVVIIGVIGLVGILIFAEVQAALPTISNAGLDNATTDLVSGFGDAMQLVPVVLLVLIASLVLGVVQRMRMG